MTSFIQKKLASGKALPEILKEERLNHNLSLDQVSFKTQISTKYLEALEAGTYDQLPGEIYNRRFIKNLANFFSLSEKKLLAIYQAEKNAQLAFNELKPKTETTSKFLSWLSPKIIRNTIIGLLIISCLAYLGLEVKNIFAPPLLEIISPSSQTITQETTITIEGRTEAEAILTINNQEILPRADGRFKAEVDLTIGLNIFNISAKKKHSRAESATVSILRQPPLG
ncbi:MAG: helix-turn-helix protein [Parcubacteria group bacterium GW2011_GWA2_43_17]|nr:MAG: helix-turn-helix protein [Parcubacteria group bacterium GW2011_GWA2_43_17]KKT93264.1 MAG: helix-turn-helix protein [Parcubacteria group bacterium GW2011_GWF2_45_11]KKT97963.1 MAG: helix-turn-helix protein [Parcubacteria group bacterium GW2011_GWC2_45_15]OGY92664.1 MAG: hypothetical protein A2260_03460 [Candidatus Komeilibacteria bacterium RIFOXYA2_FULL_45_9]OGY93568.1 MAG: hypothetical protein A3J95_02775 [Candidatus Komeilibacteria bacterium RIFOXYC2_FULL_45_12]HAH04040.1 hypothetical